MIPNPVFSAFAFVGFTLCIIPLPWHLEAWNTGTCMYMIWTAIGLLNAFINSIIWNGNAINWAPVWCDISTKIQVAITVAIPACSLCINRRLYYIASIRTVTVTRAEKRRAILVDLSIGLGIPFLQMIAQYIVQGHRFDIYEYYGCLSYTYDTTLSIPLQSLWPTIICCFSFVYSSLAIRAFMKRRNQFKELLSGNQNLNSGRYLRLILLAGTEILCTLPITTYFLVINIRNVVPWRGWEDTHVRFSAVHQFPAVLWRRFPYAPTALELSRWLLVVCAFLFFGFFGFADEARKNYRLAYDSVAKRVGYSTASMSSGIASTTDGFSKDVKTMSYSDSNVAALPNLGKVGNRSSFDSFDASVSLTDVGGFLSVKEEDFSPTATSSGSSTTAPSLPPSSDDTYSFSGSRPDISYPEPALNRSSVVRESPEMSRSASRAGSVDMV